MAKWPVAHNQYQLMFILSLSLYTLVLVGHNGLDHCLVNIIMEVVTIQKWLTHKSGQ